jgi:TnpA family transposase
LTKLRCALAGNGLLRATAVRSFPRSHLPSAKTNENNEEIRKNTSGALQRRLHRNLLGFDLLPRLKAIQIQRLYRPESGRPEAYEHLQPILTRPIDWDLIRRQYDQMVKYTTALRLGTAETEAILRRFTRSNVQHPTYKALAELGKAIKTLFLCRYLHEETLRREIHEGLNVIEQWNGANDLSSLPDVVNWPAIGPRITS